MAKVKVNFQMDESVKNYVEEQAEKLGISQNGFVNMVLVQHRQQQEAIKAMGNIDVLMNRLKDLKEQATPLP